MKILAVIPARGGSKGIPRKNVRLMDGQPLIAYALQNAQKCPLITDIAVTTDDEEAASVAGLYKAEVVERDASLTEDHVTLDPVVYDAVLRMEKRKGYTYDVVITLQATSPMLKSETLDQALREFLADHKDSYISAVNRAHLSWGKSEAGYYPNYKERLNRQQLPPHYVEAGAFLITRRDCMAADSRLGKNITIYEIDPSEAVDIDTPEDWIICERILRKKRIVFRADGYRELGMGHIHHCLTLAYRMTGHEVMFVTNQNCREGYERLKNSFLPIYPIKREEEFYEFLERYKPDIVVNDCLNTTAKHILKLKGLAGKVVTVEDLGEGAFYADAVINALYHVDVPNPNHYVGADYACLRDEFLIHRPKEFSEEIKKVLVMFGGTDPSRLTEKIYNLAEKMKKEIPEGEIHFIIGSVYGSEEHKILSKPQQGIWVHRDVKNVAEYMEWADLAFTSQGRTVFELACMGVPAIVLAQNQREQMHVFAQMENGFLNLGLGSEIEDETILSTFRWLVYTPQIRKEMRELMLRHHLEKGTERVLDIILRNP